MRCPTCQHENVADARFCGGCGTPLVAAPAVAGEDRRPSGWDLAASGMQSPPATDASANAPRREASWFHRLGAAIIDLIARSIISATVVVLAVILTPISFSEIEQVFISESSNESWQDLAGISVYSQGGYSLAYLVLGFVVTRVYEVAMWTRFQGTLGMLAVGVRVRTAADERVDLPRAIRRTLAKLVYSIPFGVGTVLWIVSAFTIGLSERRQALHDMMARTVVLRHDPAAETP